MAALCECHRVLTPDARVALYTASPDLRGPPAVPEPMAGPTHLYDDETLASLALTAGFTGVAVANDDGGQLLTARKRGPTTVR